MTLYTTNAGPHGLISSRRMSLDEFEKWIERHILTDNWIVEGIRIPDCVPCSISWGHSTDDEFEDVPLRDCPRLGKLHLRLVRRISTSGRSRSKTRRP